MIDIRAQSIYLDGSLPVAVCIPAIPPRMHAGVNGESYIERAINSVHQQKWPPRQIHIAWDHDRDGAGVTRQRALDMVTDSTIEFVAFLDDDDFWYPNHLSTLWALVDTVDGGADVAYSWFDGNNPFPMHRGRVFDPDNAHHITMNIMVRRSLAQSVRFTNRAADGTWMYEDHPWVLELAKLGARFRGTGDITWHYSVHGANTSGQPDRW